jgi:hypothetical protein
MSIESLRSAVTAARDKVDDLHARIRLGERVEELELGNAGKAFTEAEQRLIVAEKEALLKLPESEYQDRRAREYGSRSRTLG